MADTIEDEMDLPQDEIQALHDQFVQVVRAERDPSAFAAAIFPRLAMRASGEERALIEHMPQVLAVTHSFNANQRKALSRCLGIMCHGMPSYQRNKSLDGLKDLADMDRYCYYVAGVVGEMLTELFCDYSAEIREHKLEMMRLAPSFGQGLQMTNILKDVWEDRAKGVCWLPQEIFRSHGVRLSALDRNDDLSGFAHAYHSLIAVAHAHLRNALEYTLLVPAHEAGIRRFCLWALGLAVLTLRKIHRNSQFTAGAQVKVSRRTVKATIVVTNLCARSDTLLRLLFARAASPLPLTPLSEWLHPAADGAV